MMIDGLYWYNNSVTESLSLSFNDHSTTVLSQLPPSGDIKTLSLHQYRLNSEHRHHSVTGSWCYIFAGWRGEIFFSYVCCLSPGREWVTAGQRACAAWVSSTVPYVLAAVASLVCCCCLCSSERHNSPLACRSDRGVLWTLWRWGCQATRLVISTPTNLSAEPLHPSDIRGRGKTRL